MFKDYPDAALLIRGFLEGFCGVGTDYAAMVSTAEFIGCGARYDLLWDRINWVGISDSMLWSVEMYVRGIE